VAFEERKTLTNKATIETTGMKTKKIVTWMTDFTIRLLNHRAFFSQGRATFQLYFGIPQVYFDSK
jgi:hypothetical protein